MEMENTASIRDEDVQRLRKRIGYTATAQLTGKEPRNTVATVDSFRHFANGYGDDNPLFCDRRYASLGPYSGPIAPPTYLGTIGRSVGPKPPPEVVQASAGALRDVQAFQAGDEWEFYRPVREGGVSHFWAHGFWGREVAGRGGS